MRHSPTERELLGQIELLPRQVAPVNDPWPEISARIGNIPHGRVSARQSRRLWPLAVAATVLLMAATVLLLRPPGSSLPPAPASSGWVQRGQGAGTGAASEAEYHAAFREFMAAGALHRVSRQRSFEEFGSGWSTLRQAEVELTVALNQEPDSLFLNEQLQALRARQLELLQQISAADRAAWRNTI